MSPTPPPLPPDPAVPPSEAELHAYADDQLTPERRREVEAWLRQRPAEGERVQDWVAQKRALRALFDPVLDEPIPPALARAARRPPARWLGSLAAGLVVAVASGGAGWALRGAMPPERLQAARAALAPTATDPLALSSATATSFAERAAVAHAVYTPELRRPVEVDAAHEDQLVAWLSKRMGAPMKAPHLQAEGYELEGGRLLPGERGPVAQFMYRDSDGRRLTLYVSNEMAGPAAGVPPGSAAASGGGTAFRFVRAGKVNVFYWVDGPYGYAISAEADRGTLARVSDAVYRQLETVAP
jgi:anti-sigma factor RsiW